MKKRRNSMTNGVFGGLGLNKEAFDTKFQVMDDVSTGDEGSSDGFLLRDFRQSQQQEAATNNKRGGLKKQFASFRKYATIGIGGSGGRKCKLSDDGATSMEMCFRSSSRKSTTDNDDEFLSLSALAPPSQSMQPMSPSSATTPRQSRSLLRAPSGMLLPFLSSPSPSSRPTPRLEKYGSSSGYFGDSGAERLESDSSHESPMQGSDHSSSASSGASLAPPSFQGSISPIRPRSMHDLQSSCEDLCVSLAPPSQASLAPPSQGGVSLAPPSLSPDRPRPVCAPSVESSSSDAPSHFSSTSSKLNRSSSHSSLVMIVRPRPMLRKSKSDSSLSEATSRTSLAHYLVSPTGKGGDQRGFSNLNYRRSLRRLTDAVDKLDDGGNLDSYLSKVNQRRSLSRTIQSTSGENLFTSDAVIFGGNATRSNADMRSTCTSSISDISSPSGVHKPCPSPSAPRNLIATDQKRSSIKSPNRGVRSSAMFHSPQRSSKTLKKSLISKTIGPASMQKKGASDSTGTTNRDLRLDDIDELRKQSLDHARGSCSKRQDLETDLQFVDNSKSSLPHRQVKEGNRFRRSSSTSKLKGPSPAGEFIPPYVSPRSGSIRRLNLNSKTAGSLRAGLDSVNLHGHMSPEKAPQHKRIFDHSAVLPGAQSPQSVVEEFDSLKSQRVRLRRDLAGSSRSLCEKAALHHERSVAQDRGNGDGSTPHKNLGARTYHASRRRVDPSSAPCAKVRQRDRATDRSSRRRSSLGASPSTVASRGAAKSKGVDDTAAVTRRRSIGSSSSNGRSQCIESATSLPVNKKPGLEVRGSKALAVVTGSEKAALNLSPGMNRTKRLTRSQRAHSLRGMTTSIHSTAKSDFRKHACPLEANNSLPNASRAAGKRLAGKGSGATVAAQLHIPVLEEFPPGSHLEVHFQDIECA